MAGYGYEYEYDERGCSEQALVFVRELVLTLALVRVLVLALVSVLGLVLALDGRWQGVDWRDEKPPTMLVDGDGGDHGCCCLFTGGETNDKVSIW